MSWFRPCRSTQLNAVPISNAASGSEGSATLTDAQAADLTGGKYYINIHTAANPGGEIRGQVTK